MILSISQANTTPGIPNQDQPATALPPAGSPSAGADPINLTAM